MFWNILFRALYSMPGLKSDLYDHMAHSHSRFWRSAKFERNALNIPVAEDWASELWIDLQMKSRMYMGYVGIQ